ncbi:MAG: methyltransferase domain-containing protein [Rhodospirillaceae bacterium]|nr:methyltransferase domain-containing protein [Rhodospirillaceae bacterium]
MTTQSDGAAGYIHTFTPEEQQRLVDQALFLEPYHHPQINFANAKLVLDVGCGVGAQIAVLLRRWPHLKITGVEPSATQIERARTLLAKDLGEGRVTLHQAPGDQLPFPDNSFDGACVFWVFEHVPQAVPIMREILRVLKPGAPFYATEVFDKALHVHPSCPAIMRYFEAFMALQAEFGGDPNVGVRIPGLMAQAGFTGIVPTDVSPTLDARMTDDAARQAFLEYFQTLLLSGASPLLARGHVGQSLVEEVASDFARLKLNPDALFSYGAKQTWGYKPA